MKLSKCIWLTAALQIGFSEANILEFGMYHLTAKGAVYTGRFLTQATNDDVQLSTVVRFEPQEKAGNAAMDKKIIKSIRNSDKKANKRIIKSRSGSSQNKPALSHTDSGFSDSDSSYASSPTSATSFLPKICTGSGSSIAFSGSLATATVAIVDNAGPIFGILEFHKNISRLLNDSEEEKKGKWKFKLKRKSKGESNDEASLKDALFSAKEQAERSYHLLADQLIISDGTAIFDQVWGSNCQWEYITYYDPESQLVHWELIDPSGQHFMLIQQEPIYDDVSIDLGQAGAHTVTSSHNVEFEMNSGEEWDESAFSGDSGVYLTSGGVPSTETVDNQGYAYTSSDSFVGNQFPLSQFSQLSVSTPVMSQPASEDGKKTALGKVLSWVSSSSRGSGHKGTQSAQHKKHKEQPEGQTEVVFQSGQTCSHYSVSEISGPVGDCAINTEYGAIGPVYEDPDLVSVTSTTTPNKWTRDDVMVVVDIDLIRKRHPENQFSGNPPIHCKDGQTKQDNFKRPPDDDPDGSGGTGSHSRCLWPVRMQDNPSYNDPQTVSSSGSGSASGGKKHGTGESVSEAVPAALIWPVFLMAPVQYMKAGRGH